MRLEEKETKSNFSYVKVPKFYFSEFYDTLSSTEYVILCEFFNYKWTTKKDEFTSLKKISEEFNLDLIEVRTAFKKLIDEKHIYINLK